MNNLYLTPEESALLSSLIKESHGSKQGKLITEKLNQPQLLVENAGVVLRLTTADTIRDKIDESQIITELSKNPKSSNIYLTGMFQEADTYNQNKRFYSHELLNRECTRMQENIKNNSIIGELEHPNVVRMRFANENGKVVASHKITEIKMENNKVYGKLAPLTTVNGMELRALIQDGVRIGISSRGVGTLTAEKRGTFIVNDDYHKITYDIVVDPSVKKAILTKDITEKTENAEFNQLVDRLAKKLNLDNLREFYN